MIQNVVSMLELLPFNFKICGISTVVLVIFNKSFLKLDRRSVYDNLYLPRRALHQVTSSVLLWIYPKRKKVVCHSQSQFPDENVKAKQQHIHSMVICHQSDQLKNRKFYENFSEYANFSKSSGKGHKTQGQIL